MHIFEKNIKELDLEIPLSESERLAPAFKQVELFVTHGLGHRKILRSDMVLKKVSDFVFAAT